MRVRTTIIGRPDGFALHFEASQSDRNTGEPIAISTVVPMDRESFLALARSIQAIAHNKESDNDEG